MRDRAMKGRAASAPPTAAQWLLFVVIVCGVLPLVADVCIHLYHEQRAARYSLTQARLLSLVPPPEPRRSRGFGPAEEQREGVLQLERNGRTREVWIYFTRVKQSKVRGLYRVGDLVPVWASDDDMLLEPPERVELFGWFPQLHLFVAIGGTMVYLFFCAIRGERRRLYG
jgi:hypothetical protein